MTLYKFFIITLSLIGISSVVLADVYVHGYEKKDGTYVEPYYRSSPNSTTLDNWSHEGNTNPYTGELGRDRDTKWK